VVAVTLAGFVLTWTPAIGALVPAAMTTPLIVEDAAITGIDIKTPIITARTPAPAKVLSVRSPLAPWT
jgi:hypothetical protein